MRGPRRCRRPRVGRVPLARRSDHTLRMGLADRDRDALVARRQRHGAVAAHATLAARARDLRGRDAAALVTRPPDHATAAPSRAPSSRTTATMRSTSGSVVLQFTIAGRNATWPR